MKAVLFDLGHTLIDYYCDWRGPEQKCVGQMYELVSKSSPVGVERQEFSKYLGEMLVAARERKAKEMIEVPLAEVLGRCLERYDCLDEGSLQEGLEIFYGVLLEDRRIVPGAEEMLSRVKERGLLIGLISDVAWGLPSEFPLRDIEHYGLTDYFDDMVFSTDVGLRKPHPKVFKIALFNLGVEAANSMYVGNSLKQDIKGAKGVGMKAVLKKSEFCPFEEGVVPDRTVSYLHEIETIIDAM